jgi:hypothetical protein
LGGVSDTEYVIHNAEKIRLPCDKLGPTIARVDVVPGPTLGRGTKDSLEKYSRVDSPEPESRGNASGSCSNNSFTCMGYVFV